MLSAPQPASARRTRNPVTRRVRCSFTKPSMDAEWSGATSASGTRLGRLPWIWATRPPGRTPGTPSRTHDRSLRAASSRRCRQTSRIRRHRWIKNRPAKQAVDGVLLPSLRFDSARPEHVRLGFVADHVLDKSTITGGSTQYSPVRRRVGAQDQQFALALYFTGNFDRLGGEVQDLFVHGLSVAGNE